MIAIYCQNYENYNYNIQIDKNIQNNDFKDLIVKMLKINPKNRLTWKEYFEHPFFNNN